MILLLILVLVVAFAAGGAAGYWVATSPNPALDQVDEPAYGGDPVGREPKDGPWNELLPA